MFSNELSKFIPMRLFDVEGQGTDNRVAYGSAWGGVSGLLELL